MKITRKAGLLFHTGLLLFSIAPALIAMLLLMVAGAGFVISSAGGLLTILLLQICGILYEMGITNNPIPLRLSFWTLKALQSVHAFARHTPEKMVVAMNNRKALSRAGENSILKKSLSSYLIAFRITNARSDLHSILIHAKDAANAPLGVCLTHETGSALILR